MYMPSSISKSGMSGYHETTKKTISDKSSKDYVSMHEIAYMTTPVYLPLLKWKPGLVMYKTEIKSKEEANQTNWTKGYDLAIDINCVKCSLCFSLGLTHLLHAIVQSTHDKYC
jgi:hypothetical protein